MSATLKPAPTAAAIPAEWIAERRAIILRVGYATRAGEPATIEIKSLTTDTWFALTLPNDGQVFATAADRDAVLKLLQEGHTNEDQALRDASGNINPDTQLWNGREWCDVITYPQYDANKTYRMRRRHQEVEP